VLQCIDIVLVWDWFHCACCSIHSNHHLFMKRKFRLHYSSYPRWNR
jgi:hypothetical protein